MKRFIEYICTALIVCAASSGMFAQAAKQTKPTIMILGTYHFANPGRDISNSKADDVLAEKRQKEIVELIALLKKFKPTRIAVEQPTTNAKVNERYSAYLNGKLELTANETDQIGFRLAKDLNHKQIFTVDWQGYFNMDKMIKSAAVTSNCYNNSQLIQATLNWKAQANI